MIPLLFLVCFTTMTMRNISNVFLLSTQSYDTKFLKVYPELASTPLQLEEDLEQLKVLENGYKMKVCPEIFRHFLSVLFMFFVLLAKLKWVREINFLSCTFPSLSHCVAFEELKAQIPPLFSNSSVKFIYILQ